MRIFALISILFAGFLVPRAAAQWTNVPPVNFATLSLSQFSDWELEVPYYLFHFAQVANAVVETGTNRGFLNLKVNREPVDNQPYNARIMEMQVVLAYFYTANRPWNRYRDNHAVRVRLEAMLDRWTRIQNQPGSADGDYDGLFSEYSPSNWSLAPTGFGVRHAAEALDLIIDSGLPFDAAILEASRVSLRRALLALFTRSDMRNAAKQYSNQFSGAVHAALIYLENWPDAQLDAAFIAALNASAVQDQSPAGFWYEQGGPDFGYSGVHENNFRIALSRLRYRADLLPVVVADDVELNDWLAANYVPQPGVTTRTFLVNAGVDTRTSYSYLTPAPRPLSEFVPQSRSFSYTEAEYAAYLITRRSQVQGQFGGWGALNTNSSSSYTPGFVHDAVTNLDVWNPTAAQRAVADTALPCFSTNSFNRQYQDPLPTSYTFVKRPQYYAAVTTGSIRISRQAYGLGLLWNPVFGIALQSVAGTLSGNNWVFGTKRSGMTSTYETATIPATTTAGGGTVTPVNGVRTLASGDVSITYNLAASGTTYGQKTITLGPSLVNVSLTHSGGFTENLPLAHASDATLNTTSNRVVLRRPNGSSATLEILSPGATIGVGGLSSLATGLVRRLVSITASGNLAYRLTLSDGFTATATPDFATTGSGNPLLLDVLANDLSTGGPLTLTGVTAPAHGTASLTNQLIWYVPAPGFGGVDTFQYFITNGSQSATGMVSITVSNPPAVPPTLGPLGRPVAQAGGPWTLALQAADSSSPPQSLTFRLLAAPVGAVIDSATGQIDWQPAADLKGTSHQFIIAVTQNGWLTNLPPVADTYVRNGTPTSNYGSNTTLEVKLGSATTTREAYLRFAIPPLPGDIRDAMLRVTATGTFAAGVHAVAQSTNAAWDELTLNWNNRPGTSNALATWQPQAGLTSSVEISDTARMTGANGLLSLRIYATNTTADGLVTYGSREGAANLAPSLAVVSTNGPLLSATQSFSVIVIGPPEFVVTSNQVAAEGALLNVTNTAADPNFPPQRLSYSLLSAPTNAAINATNGLVTWKPSAAQIGSNLFTLRVTQNGWLTNLLPVADAYVRNGTPTSNYGYNATLDVKLGSAATTREAYLRFALDSLPGSVQQAMLQLQPTTAFSPGIHALALVTNDNWDEYAVNWNTRPDSGLPAMINWLPMLGAAVQLDLTSLVAAEVAGDGLLSLRLWATNATADGLVSYGAREGGIADAPCLQIVSTNSLSLSATQSFWVVVTPPHLSPPVLGITGFGGGSLTLQLASMAGVPCSIQASTNLLDWATVFTTNGPTGIILWTDPAAGVFPQRYYRAVAGRE